MNRVGIESPIDLQDGRIETTTAGIIYRRWSKLLMRTGVPVHPAQTPYERAEKLGAALPEISAHGWTIVKAYTQERFGNQTIAVGSVKHAWRESWPRMLRVWLLRLINKWIGKITPAGQSETRNK
jgi:hypothetical protein